MTMRMRHLRLRAVTSDGVFGTDLPFRAGLNILSAGNTTGKSTCLQAILYGLGLERMLSPRREIPLPYVMQDYVNLDKDTRGPSVIESWISIEIENSQGEILTIRRTVKGEEDWRLISTWSGPMLTDSSASASQRDFFVRDPGAAQREAGFHPFLARFLGWDLPEVPTFDDKFVPLYLETIFPLLFVEQKAGWSAIQGPFPTFLRIREVGHRVMEFLLDLDARRVRVRRRELESKIRELSHRWRETKNGVDRLIRNANSRTEGIPNEPTAEFGLEQRFQILLYRDAEWRDLNTILKDDRERLALLIEHEIPTIEDASEELQIELAELRNGLEELSAQRDAVFNELARDRAEHAAVQRRLAALQSDLTKNKDARKLRDFGSILGTLNESGVCPTCHQTVEPELLPPNSGEVMALDENIIFLGSQIKLYKAMSGSTERRVEELDRRFTAMNEQIVSTRSRIRAVRSALIAPDSAPSEALIRERLELEKYIETREMLQQSVSEIVQELVDLVSEYIVLRGELADLPRSEFSTSDNRKMERLGALVRGQLSDYGFSTYPPSEILISSENFRPFVLVRENDMEVQAELGFQMSASDAIRMKWAYLLSIFELGREFGTNHPGFLILDEPRQQEADHVSFDALIARAARCAGADRQIIFATSETPEELSGAIEGLDINLLYLEGLLIKPLSSDFT